MQHFYYSSLGSLWKLDHRDLGSWGPHAQLVLRVFYNWGEVDKCQGNQVHLVFSKLLLQHVGGQWSWTYLQTTSPCRIAPPWVLRCRCHFQGSIDNECDPVASPMFDSVCVIGRLVTKMAQALKGGILEYFRRWWWCVSHSSWVIWGCVLVVLKWTVD